MDGTFLPMAITDPSNWDVRLGALPAVAGCAPLTGAGTVSVGSHPRPECPDGKAVGRIAGSRHRATRLLLPLILSLLLPAWPLPVRAQGGGDGPKSSPSESAAEERAEAQIPEPSPRRPLTLKALPQNILSDQKFLWVQPFRANGLDLRWRIGLVGATVGLIAIDRPVAQELSDSPPGGGYAFARRVEQWGGGPTDFGVAGAFYLFGRLRGDERARFTGLLGLQAVTNSLIVVEILKTTSRRPRPTQPGGVLQNHNADGAFFTGGRSFPSGHSAEAWALATVVAHQYQHRRWVPPTAYGLAGMVAVSRVIERRHFPSDIFVGSILGYLIGRHVFHTAHPESRKTIPGLSLTPYVPPTGGAALQLAWEF